MSCNCTNSLDSGFAFEGGDIILTADYVFVGISGQNAVHGISTDAHFLTHLQQYCQKRTVIPIRLQEDVQHLDLCFNILPFNDNVLGCIVCSALVEDWDNIFPVLSDIFGKRIVVISVEEAGAFVCNYLILRPGTIVMSDSKQASRVANRIKQFGYIQMIKIDFAFVQKYLGGGIHCVTLPLRRFYTDQRGPIDVCDDIAPLLDVVVGIVTPDKETTVCKNAITSIGCTHERTLVLAKISNCIENLCAVLRAFDINIHRPSAEILLQVPACNALFTRDVAVAIDQQLIYAHMHLEHREKEGKAVLRNIL